MFIYFHVRLSAYATLDATIRILEDRQAFIADQG